MTASPSEALQAAAAIWKRAGHGGEVAEIYVHVGQTLTVDLDPASGLLQESVGGGRFATVRLWTPEGLGRAEGWWAGPAES